MYAHQAFDSICEAISVRTNNDEYRDLWKKIKNMIMDAQQFHLGEIDKQDILKSYTGKKLFNQSSENGLNIPYQTVWIDWKQNIDSPPVDLKSKTVFPKKEASLVKSIDKHNYLLFAFSHVTNQMRSWLNKDMWVMFPVWFQITYSHDNGEYLGYPCCIPSLVNKIGNEGAINISKELDRNVTAVAMLLDFLNCKNITTVDNPPPEKLNKKRAKKGKCPLFTYKTLVIKPTGKKQSSQEAQGLWENRVHLCRGHFKTYTEENPLFGKFTGRYWWQPSVRGNKSKGVVMKDYRVEAA